MATPETENEASNIPKSKFWNFKRKKRTKPDPILDADTTEALQGQIKTAKEAEAANAAGVKGKIEGDVNIDTDFQRTFAGDLFATQATRAMENTAQGYAQDAMSWQNSKASRTRLVIIEATEATDIETLAQTTLNASPMERVLITGLTKDKQTQLETELKKLWIARTSENKYSELEWKLKSLRKNQTADNKINPFVTDRVSFDGFINDKIDKIGEMELGELMGPHLFKEDLDISHRNISELDPQFDVNLEELLYFGQDDGAVQELGNLGREIDGGVPVFSVRSTPFEENENSGLWKSASNNPQEFLAEIAKGKTPAALLGKNTGDTYDHVILSSSFQKMLSLDTMKGEMEAKGIDPSVVKDVAQEDLDYFKEILFDNAVYRPGVSPNSLEVTRSKGKSLQVAEKSDEVSKKLLWNIVDRPVSSAIEVDYAIGGMALGGGGDIESEDLKKRNSYKLFYETVVQKLTENGKQPEEAIALAFAQTLQAYVANEKKNKKINDLEHGNTGADAWRALGVKYTNIVKRSNDIGIKALTPSMPLFAAGSLLGPAWSIAGAATKIAAKVNWVLGGIGMGITAASVAVKGVSMHHQIKANKTDLNIANDALAVANEKMMAAQEERKTLLATQLAGVQKALNDNGNDALRNHTIDTSANSELIVRKTSENAAKKQSLLERIGLKKKPKATAESTFLTPDDEKIMLDTLKEINEQMPDIDPEVRDEVITAEGQLAYTRNLYDIQAERSTLIANQEYDNNITSWMESGSNRARLLVLEATNENVEQLAESVFKTSPIERLVVAGLTEELKPHFEAKLRALWTERAEANAANGHSKNPFESESSEDPFVVDQATVQQGWSKYMKAIEESSLEKLMGPHLFTGDLDISHSTLSEKYPQFDVNIEEVLCYGKSKELAENLEKLGPNIKSGVPVFAIKSESLTEADEGLWKCAHKESEDQDSKKFLDEIITGKSAAELIGQKEGKGYAHIEMSSTFQELFQLEAMQGQIQQTFTGDSEEQKEIIDNLDQEDLDYFQKILFEEAVCPGNITPEGLEKVNTKTSTQLDSLAGEAVGKALPKNLYGNPESTVKEVVFSIAGMALDAGGDLYRHQLDKKTAYTALFQKLKNSYSTSGEDDMTPEKATKRALADTVATYVTIEKCSKNMTEKLQEAQEWRSLALDMANATKQENDAAVKALVGSKQHFAAGVTMGVVGVATTAVMPPAGVAVLSAAGMVNGALQTGRLGLSTRHMRKANGEFLPPANYAVAQIDSEEKKAHQLRKAMIAEALEATQAKNGTTIGSDVSMGQTPQEAQQQQQGQELKENAQEEKVTEALTPQSPSKSSIVSLPPSPSSEAAREEKKEEQEMPQEQRRAPLRLDSQNSSEGEEKKEVSPYSSPASSTRSIGRKAQHTPTHGRSEELPPPSPGYEIPKVLPDVLSVDSNDVMDSPSTSSAGTVPDKNQEQKPLEFDLTDSTEWPSPIPGCEPSTGFVELTKPQIPTNRAAKIPIPKSPRPKEGFQKRSFRKT